MSANANKEMADNLRGLDSKVLDQARQAGRSVSGQVVKMDTVKTVGPAAATPAQQKDQAAPAERFRHVNEKQQQAVARPAQTPQVSRQQGRGR